MSYRREPGFFRLFALRTISFLMLAAMFAWIGCGSGSSPSPTPTPRPSPSPTPTPSPTPAFTSTASIDAAEGELYTYEVAATDPTGGTITYSIALSPPGATMTGNTLTWTPDHSHSRIQNSFQIRAQSSNGPSATQSFTLSPKGTIAGTAVDTFLTKDGDVLRYNLMGTNPPIVFAPNGEGGYDVITGTGNDDDGSFTVPQVPAGPYLIGFLYSYAGNPVWRYTWTRASDLDLGQELQGRPDCTPAEYSRNPPLVTIDSTLSDLSMLGVPFMLWYSGNAAFYPLGIEGIVNNPYHGEVFQQYPCLIESAKGDDAYAIHYGVPSSGASGVRVIREMIGPVTMNQVQGVTSTVTSPFVTITGDQQVHPQVAVSQFYNLVPQTAPGGTTVTRSNVFAIRAQPYATHVSTTLGPDLVSYSGIDNTDLDLGTISFSNPFPNHMPYTYFASQYYVRLDVGLGSATTLTGGVGVLKQALPVAATPLTPTVGPVRAPRIDGEDLLVTHSGVSSTPTLSWTPPALGTATQYQVTLYPLGPDKPAGRVLWTTETQITLPNGALLPGKYYAIQVTAYNRLGSSDAAPFRGSGDYGFATIVSSPQQIATEPSANTH